MTEPATVMPTSDQLDQFRTTLRTALLNRNATVRPGWPSRGLALDAIEAAWGNPDGLHGVDAAMTVLGPDVTLMSARERAWWGDAIYAALINLSDCEESTVAYSADDLLHDLARHGVTCDAEGDQGWVDSTADEILKALLAAGWEPPPSQPLTP